eukprot:TRINITY_DN5217_c0_g1_i1.p1 TRINITY_DN5217_c0_g1~~TRINITY_DN5217_c0_g1_i1.p1  ORF type:complete len:190 (-),score=50.62 TRINITY_DN5217_c0_g1_i1:115-684(-)
MKFSVLLLVSLALSAYGIRLDQFKKMHASARGPHFGNVGDIWSNCGSASDHLQIKAVQITPDPPVIGQNLTVAATGVLDEQITSGVVAVNIAWNGVPLISQNFSLCDIVTSVEKCPLVAGPQSFKVSQLLPAQTPSGSFDGTVSGYDQNGQNVFCIKLDFTLGKNLKNIVPPRSRAANKKRAIRARMQA